MNTFEAPPASDLLVHAMTLVVAYVSKNAVPATELPSLIANVHAALTGLTSDASLEPKALQKPTPAQIRKSITPEALISFEDGKPYKTLRRHLTPYDLTPETYRTKWGLPTDYPMTASAYSAQRSELAKSLGLGRSRRKALPEPAEAEPAAKSRAPARRRGRPPAQPKAPADA